MSVSAVFKMCWRCPPGPVAGVRSVAMATIVEPSGGPVEPFRGRDDNLLALRCVCHGVVDAVLAVEGLVMRAPVSRASVRNQLLEAVFSEHYSGFCRLAALLLGDGAAAE